ncbi:hypothetical protein SAMN05444278_11049 [Psychroflexus salarius]|uniref:PEP-CTERM protein-sorting domain-containing protein n=1 Tax=Psychroflexus salarius TaxID=1155689 RepID=A0A1M4XSR9_9FLAO|nr:hypothetical protein [Psychroflexus salarius]SHE96488.1 hypothetical protein SAMN05444278_11049 [Psychroflexus salarius]
MKKFYLILIILGLVSTNVVQAQPGGGTTPPPPPDGTEDGSGSNTDDVPLPINTFLLLGLGVGAVAGVKSLSKPKK